MYYQTNLEALEEHLHVYQFRRGLMVNGKAAYCTNQLKLKLMRSHLVAVGIPEVDNGERRTPARVVDDILHDALDVAIPLGVVDGPESGGPLPVLGVGLEDGAGTLPLGADNTTHFRKIFHPSARLRERPEKEEIEVLLTFLDNDRP